MCLTFPKERYWVWVCIWTWLIIFCNVIFRYKLSKCLLMDFACQMQKSRLARCTLESLGYEKFRTQVNFQTSSRAANNSQQKMVKRQPKFTHVWGNLNSFTLYHMCDQLYKTSLTTSFHRCKKKTPIHSFTGWPFCSKTIMNFMYTVK